MATVPPVIFDVVTVDGAKLNLTSGDVLAIMIPQRINDEQAARMKIALREALPDGVKVLLLDNGMTVAAITYENESVDGPSPAMCNDILGKPGHYPGR